MKKKSSPVMPYVIPEGYYLPIDAATKKKRGRPFIFLAIAAFLAGLLFWSTFIGVTFHLFKGAALKIYQSEFSYVTRQAEPYTHGDAVLLEKNSIVDAGPFRLCLPKNGMEMSEDEDRFYYDYTDPSGEIHIASDKMLLVYNEADWRDYMWGNPFLYSEAKMDALIANYNKLFGFNPLENLYNYDRALYTVDYEKLNCQSFDESMARSYFLLEKWLCCDPYDAVYALNTDTYRGFVQVLHTEDGIELFLEAYAHDVPEEQYNIYITCTGDYTEDAYAILNAAELRPDAQKIAYDYYDAYQRSQETPTDSEDPSQNIAVA